MVLRARTYAPAFTSEEENAPEWFFLPCSASNSFRVPTKNSIFPPTEIPSPVVKLDSE